VTEVWREAKIWICGGRWARWSGVRYAMFEEQRLFVEVGGWSVKGL